MTNNIRLPPLVRSLDSLDRQELMDTLADVFEALYLDCDAAGRFVWNPDREWDVCTLDEVAALLHRQGLVLLDGPADTKGVPDQPFDSGRCPCDPE